MKPQIGKKRLYIVSFDWATFYNFFSKIDLVTLKIPRLFQNIIWEGNGNNRLLSLSTLDLGLGDGTICILLRKKYSGKILNFRD